MLLAPHLSGELWEACSLARSLAWFEFMGSRFASFFLLDERSRDAPRSTPVSHRRKVVIQNEALSLVSVQKLERAVWA